MLQNRLGNIQIKLSNTTLATIKYGTIILLFNILFILPASCQKRVHWDVDLFPLDLNTHILFNLNSGFSIGLEGEFGINFSNYILLAGSHFSNKFTLIRYQKRDAFGDEAYFGLIGIGIFTRIRDEKKIPLDIGLRTEAFLHFNDSDDNAGAGTFYGAYINAFRTIKYKTKNNKKIRKISIGMRASMGVFSEYSVNEFGVLTDFWFRFHLVTD